MASPSVLRPVTLIRLEEQDAILEASLLASPQLAEASIVAEDAEATEQTTFLRKAGALAMKAVGLIEDKINKAAIYTQIKTWDVVEIVTSTVEHTKDYLKLQGGRAVAHGALAGLAIAAGAGLMELKDSGTAYAETNQATYQVVDGPYYLHDPHNFPQIASPTIGLGQTGDTLTITCHETSDNVSGDAEWDLVTDQNNGLTGYMADYGTNTPVGAFAGTPQGQEGAQLTALGVPECGSGMTPNQTPDTQPVTSVFFSPIYGQADGLPLLPNVASANYAREEWSSGDCSDEKMMQLIQNIPSTVNTLAGWSRGRMGPAYFLETASQSQKDQIHTIILFDPGDTSSFTSGGCETDSAHPHDLNALYASWLNSNGQNHLIIYTGIDTEEGSTSPNPQPFQEQLQNGTFQQQPYIDNETFAGLWKYYLAGIWNQPFANRAQICDYNGMSHEDVLRNFAYTVQNPQSSCPVAADGQQPAAWNP